MPADHPGVSLLLPDPLAAPVLPATAPPGAVDRDGRPLAEAGRIVLAFGADGAGTALPADPAPLYEAMAMRLRGLLRSSDPVVVVPDGLAAVLHLGAGEPESVAFVVARRLLGVLRQPYAIGGDLRIRPSIGAACAAPGSGEDANALLVRARAALDQARRQPVEPFAIAS